MAKRKESSKIIDAHCHLHKPEWIYPGLRSPSFILEHYGQIPATETEIARNMEEAGIAKTVVFALPDVNVDLQRANEYVLGVAAKDPRFIPFATVDENPEYWLERGAKGFKEHVYGQLKIRKPHSDRVYQTIAASGKPLVAHLGENRVERLAHLFSVAPDLKVILAHLGADFPEDNNYQPRPEQIRETLLALKGYPNLYADISAIRNPEIIREGINILGSKRVLFGADFPDEPPIKTLERLNQLSLSEKDLEQILYKNAQSLLSEQ